MIRSYAGLLRAEQWARDCNDEPLTRALDRALVEATPQLVQAVAAPEGPRERWLVQAYVATGNDVVTHAIDPLSNDDGFTASLRLGAALAKGDTRWSTESMYQMLTERGGLSRWDQAESVLKLDRTHAAGKVDIVFGPRLGVAFGGNAAGAAIQNWFHTQSGIIHGKSLRPGRGEPRLQNRYRGDARAGALVGGRAGVLNDDVLREFFGHHKHLPKLSMVFALDEQRAVGGTGLTYLALQQDNELEFALGPVRPFVGYAVTARLQDTRDPNLVPYYRVDRPYLAHTFETGLRVGSWELDFDIQTNMGGTGQWNGTLRIGYQFN